MDTPQQIQTQPITVIQPEEVTDTPDETNGINIYPVIRHLLLILCILLALSIIIFLIYQNGKSIYDKGI